MHKLIFAQEGHTAITQKDLRRIKNKEEKNYGNDRTAQPYSNEF